MVVVEGSKPVSFFPRTDIVAVIIMGSEIKTPMSPQRTSSSSLTSVGEVLVAVELLVVHWQGVDPSITSPLITHPSTSAGASSPSTVGSASRPVLLKANGRSTTTSLIQLQLWMKFNSPRNHSRGLTTSTTSFPELKIGCWNALRRNIICEKSLRQKSFLSLCLFIQGLFYTFIIQ